MTAIVRELDRRRTADTDGRTWPRRVRRLHAVAIAATAGALALTVLAIDGPAVVERNPVAGAMLRAGGWPLAAAVAYAGVTLAYEVFGRVARRGYRRTARTGAAAVAAVSVADVAVNAVVLGVMA